MNCTRRSEQFNLEVPLSTVLRRIEQCFLQHSKEWKGNLQRHMAWEVMASEVNFDLQKVLAAVSIPKYSKFEERNRCDIA